MSEERTVLVDASVFITLAGIGETSALTNIEGNIVVPTPVKREIQNPAASEQLDSLLEDGYVEKWDAGLAPLRTAADHLGKDVSEDDLSGYGHATVEGDIGLLAIALMGRDPDSDVQSPLVLTDDKPLRKTCTALSVPVSGSIGVLVRAVERGDLAPEEATDALEAMDAVGARLSASLLRRAERMIDAAAQEND